MPAPEVDAFVSSLLAKHGILNYRTLFSEEKYSKKTMPKSNDHIIKPFALTPHEKSLPTALTELALSKFHTRISPVEERVIPVLVLEALKKKSFLDSPLRPGVASPHKGKGGEKRRRKSQHATSADDGAPLVEKKRARAGGGDRCGRKQGTGGEAVPAGSGGRVCTVPPEVLQPQLEAVFRVFWELELQPPSLAVPFFGLITRTNCDALGLPRFFDRVLESCSLANISEKLKSHMYTTLESFEADFNLMFNNIFSYFPASSPQHVKAKELQVLFRDRWTHVLLDLKEI